MSIRRTVLTVVALTVLCVTVALAQYAGPKLEGTATLRSGETISGIVLDMQLGIVDGAEIGSSLTDGGYIAIAAEGGERDVKATDIASLDVEWSNTGTADAPKWRIAKLTVVTTGGETVTGEPTWLVHATSLNVELADGTRKKVYAFPLAGANFSPDNLLAKLVLGATGATVAPVAPVTPTPAPAVTPTPTPAPAVTPAPATTTEVVTIEPATPPTAVTPAVTPTVTPTVTVAAPPIVTSVPAGTVFAAGEPAVIVFEVINPETGNPMKIKFLLVPLPAE